MAAAETDRAEYLVSEDFARLQRANPKLHPRDIPLRPLADPTLRRTAAILTAELPSRLDMDGENCFNRDNRQCQLMLQLAVCPQALGAWLTCYRGRAQLCLDAEFSVLSDTGFTQGDPLAILYNLTAWYCKRRVETPRLVQHPLPQPTVPGGAKVMCFCDDTSANGLQQHTSSAYHTLHDVTPVCGYKPKPSKCHLYVGSSTVRLLTEASGAFWRPDAPRHSQVRIHGHLDAIYLNTSISCTAYARHWLRTERMPPVLETIHTITKYGLSISSPSDQIAQGTFYATVPPTPSSNTSHACSLRKPPKSLCTTLTLRRVPPLSSCA